MTALETPGTVLPDFGGSLQLNLGRFELLEDTDPYRAGTVLWTEALIRATYRLHPDGKLRLRAELCTGDPVPLAFICGGRVVLDDPDGTGPWPAGWEMPAEARKVRMGIDLWSINVLQGAAVGFYRWSGAATDTHFVGSHLVGNRAAPFRIGATLDSAAGFTLRGEKFLPDYETGLQTP